MSIYEMLVEAKFNLAENETELAREQIERAVGLLKEGKSVHEFIREEK